MFLYSLFSERECVKMNFDSSIMCKKYYKSPICVCVQVSLTNIMESSFTSVGGTGNPDAQVHRGSWGTLWSPSKN